MLDLKLAISLLFYPLGFKKTIFFFHAASSHDDSAYARSLPLFALPLSQSLRAIGYAHGKREPLFRQMGASHVPSLSPCDLKVFAPAGVLFLFSECPHYFCRTNVSVSHDFAFGAPVFKPQI